MHLVVAGADVDRLVLDLLLSDHQNVVILRKLVVSDLNPVVGAWRMQRERGSERGQGEREQAKGKYVCGVRELGKREPKGKGVCTQL